MKKRLFLPAVAIIIVAILLSSCKKTKSSSPSSSGIINTIAGNGSAGYGGDGVSAIATSLYNPSGVAIDNSGNIYIADQGNNRIRKVNASGIISTFAGNGFGVGLNTGGYTGDGGPAINAEFYTPVGIAVDASGNVYIADENNNCVRKVNTAGIISTIAGNGIAGYTGNGGPASAAQLDYPSAVVVDNSGNVYIADEFNSVIRKVNTSGVITTFAGDTRFGYGGDGSPATSAKLGAPSGVAVDNSGNVYIADLLNGRIREVNTSGIITTIAGNGNSGYSGDGGPATAAELYGPISIVVDASGNIYIADQNNQRVRKVSTSGIITTIAGNGASTGAGIGGYSGDGGTATAAELSNPWGMAVDASGNVYFADEMNNRIRKVSK